MGKIRIKEENLEKLKGLHEFIPDMKPPVDDTVPDLSIPANRPSYSPPDLARDYQEADVGMPTVPVLLVCPDCKVDVEPVELGEELPIPEGTIALVNPLVRESAFCYCPKCQLRYFKFELIKWKSWRRKI